VFPNDPLHRSWTGAPIVESAAADRPTAAELIEFWGCVCALEAGYSHPLSPERLPIKAGARRMDDKISSFSVVSRPEITRALCQRCASIGCHLAGFCQGVHNSRELCQNKKERKRKTSDALGQLGTVPRGVITIKPLSAADTMCSISLSGQSHPLRLYFRHQSIGGPCQYWIVFERLKPLLVVVRSDK
jgi:hypothetical protein